MKGFFHRLLVIDVGKATFHVENIEEKVLAETLGGKGLATRILLEKNPAGVDPLSPENDAKPYFSKREIHHQSVKLSTGDFGCLIYSSNARSAIPTTSSPF